MGSTLQLHAGKFFAGCDLPHADRSIKTSRNHTLAIRIESNRPHLIRMGHANDFLTTRSLPDASSVPSNRLHILAISTEDKRNPFTTMVQRGQFSTTGSFPYVDRT